MEYSTDYGPAVCFNRRIARSFFATYLKPSTPLTQTAVPRSLPAIQGNHHLSAESA